MTIQSLPTIDVASVSTGILIGTMQGIYDVCEHIAGGQVYTHQLGDRRFRSVIHTQWATFPRNGIHLLAMAEAELSVTDAGQIHWPSDNAPDGMIARYIGLISAKLIGRFGETLDIDGDQFDIGDPIEALARTTNAPIIAMAIPTNES